MKILARPRARIPLWVKLPFTAFVAVLVPFYLHSYGPTNFLYFCDLALLMTVVAIWLESALLASAALVGILVPQLLWMLDFCTGGNVFHLATYMFDGKIEFFTRFLSFFHFWLPLLLIYLVCKLGYDWRGYLLWSAPSLAVLLPICYFVMPPPSPSNDPNKPANINYVFGLVSETQPPQKIMDPNLWFALELIALPTLFWFPAHAALSRFCRPPWRLDDPPQISAGVDGADETAISPSR